MFDAISQEEAHDVPEPGRLRTSPTSCASCGRPQRPRSRARISELSQEVQPILVLTV